MDKMYHPWDPIPFADRTLERLPRAARERLAEINDSLPPDERRNAIKKLNLPPEGEAFGHEGKSSR